MTLQPGARFGPYEIVAALGAGGMGEVYRARDPRLHRDVAIKVLPEVFAADTERLARFQREAQVLASISHPNIAGIHGVEEQAGVHALVLELVEGDTLADLIGKQTPEAESLRSRPRDSEAPAPRGGGAPRKLDIDDALAIAKQIAEALEAAHEQGVIHRDLKPANVKVTPDGVVKVLDFGLAKLAEPVGTGAVTVGGGALTQSPTITSPAKMTAIGMILGTAAYMSPEQAKGRPADKRSDIWAFGCVLYELLAGNRAFGGEDLSDVLASVLKSEPDWRALPSDVPAHIRTLIQRCLVKDRRQRIANMSVALFVLGDAAHVTNAEGADGHTPQASLGRRLAVPVAAVLVTGAIVGPFVWLATRGDPVLLPVTRFTLSASGRGALVLDNQSRDLAITHDGKHIIYKGAGDGTATQLFVRAKDQLEPRALQGLGNPRAPAVSPDGQWIAFVEPAPVTLNKVSISGGPLVPLSKLDGASRGVTWGDDGNIVFGTAFPSTGLQRVSSDGGEPTVLTRPDRERGENDHLWPQLLPGGRAVLFTITSAAGGIEAAQIAILDLQAGSGTSTPRILIRGGTQAQYVASGHLVYVVGGTLRAVGFDLDRLEIIGSPVPVLSDVVTLANGTAEFDVGRDGTLVYVPGGAQTAPQRTLVWVDRQGREEPTTGAPARSYVYPRLSPDGTRLALDIRDQENDIWVFDLARLTLERLTHNPGLDESPVWTPDGRRVIYSSQIDGPTGLFWQPADATSAPERLTQSDSPQRASAISPDGTRVVFWQSLRPQTLIDLFTLTLGSDRPVAPLLQTPFQERNGVISPDGRWMAYESNDSGQFQISVRPYPDINGGRWAVSTGGGTRPLWSANGRELFYLAADGAVMAVPVASGTAWSAGRPTQIFAWSQSGVSNTQPGRNYDVSADGKRFLMIKDATGPNRSAPPAIVVVENWLEELKRLVPTRR